MNPIDSPLTKKPDIPSVYPFRYNSIIQMKYQNLSFETLLLEAAEENTQAAGTGVDRPMKISVSETCVFGSGPA